MPSKRRIAPVVGRDGINNSSSTREQDASTVELDTTFGRLLGLSEGQRVSILGCSGNSHDAYDVLGRHIYSHRSASGSYDQY